MKKIVFTLLIASMLFSCKKDDDGNTEISLDGTWRLTAFTTENAYDLNEDGTSSNDVIAETGCYQNETLVFNSDNTGTATTRSFADISLELVTGSTTEYEYSVECIQETDDTAITWTQTGNTVVVSGLGVAYTGTVAGSTLTITIPSGFIVEVVEGSGTGFTTEDITFEYTKQ